MKAILEFEVDEPQDRKELKRVTSATEMSIALWDIDVMFRNKLKYDETLSEGEYDIISSLREDFWTILKDQDVEFILEG